jgi:hypothetical protein
MNLVQSNEKKPVEKFRFPALIDEKIFNSDLIKKFKYSEFEICFKHKIDPDFLDPKKSDMDLWIFESIPYQNGPNPFL